MLIPGVASNFININGRYFQNCIITEDQCPNENITFWLYTNSTSNNPIELNIMDMSKDIFLIGKKLKILIHGYTGHKDFDPNTQIRPALLHSLDLNVISVDYGPLAESPCYIQALFNIQVVAKCTGLLINNLIKNDIFKNDDIHVIGFSLGGQVSGMISNYVDQKLNRITGLDPAKPGFGFRSSKYKLDASDAKFVDVIHTDSLGRGILLSAGHVDFYPNSGLTQPGCNLQNETSVGSCNHVRAPEYYAESITSELGFYGYNCSNWLQYVVGLCKQTNQTNVERMGYNISENARGNYFLETNLQSPYARGPNRILRSKYFTLPDEFSVNKIFTSDECGYIDLDHEMLIEDNNDVIIKDFPICEKKYLKN